MGIENDSDKAEFGSGKTEHNSDISEYSSGKREYFHHDDVQIKQNLILEKIRIQFWENRIPF